MTPLELSGRIRTPGIGRSDAAAPAARLRPDARTTLVDLGERTALIGALMFSISANVASQRWLNLAIIGNDVIVVLFVLMRRRARLISRSPLDWALAFGASLGVLLMRPGGVPLIGAAWVMALAVPGWLISLAAKLSLNRAFGIVAANRGVQARGAYAIVRHPMYLGYFLNHTAYLLLNPRLLNLAVWLAVCACQAGRILREEKLLLADPAYQAYAARVRRRILPGLL